VFTGLGAALRFRCRSVSPGVVAKNVAPASLPIADDHFLGVQVVPNHVVPAQISLDPLPWPCPLP
jgi:hypothetical protein